MDIVSVIGSATTVVSFVAFVGVVVWAYSGRRKRAFDDAANAPFALPDDAGGVAARVNSGERQS
ncbi:MAG: cbb3-type cytochrome c oxidase subunit 3 [Burkholderiales bacterium]|jgi:cytochrome c oxidase cbb3-type subunit 4|nr:cbb3-type cytochrome c oxidase subunit 3 [Betaproteobacteria bacterium]MBK6805699.1 cbb3-type cytochrome c oxidase subunit 3 [Betaproteobacteria bacterium]MBP6368516.1 cbb3-type cytochrome c oxidase subunit 3 [Burkholderiales bacterium]